MKKWFISGVIFTLALGCAGNLCALEQREIRLKVVNAEDGKVIGGVSVHYTLDEAKFEKVQLDGKGEYRLDLKEAKQARFDISKEGFVNELVSFGGEYGIKPIPSEYTVKLAPGVKVGGVVHDEEGKPVAGAKLSLQFEYEASDKPRPVWMTHGSAETDAEGRWSFSGAPAKTTRTSIYAFHPDFISASRSGNDTESFAELRKASVITTVQRGMTVSGLVLDDQGKPIEGADVASDRFGMRGGVKSDKDGKFVLRAVAPGPRQLVAKAPKHGPQILQVTVSKTMEPVEFVLPPGRVVRGTVVDTKGKPVAKARISVEKWRGSYALMYTDVFTDAAGKFVWDWAPSDPVTISIAQNGYQKLNVAAERDELALVLRPSVLLRGTVVDDETNAPIDKFKVELIGTHKDGGTHGQRQGTAGKLELTYSFEADQYLARIEADGYLPVTSPPNDGQSGVIEFNARLKKGAGAIGVVFKADGKPAADAQIVLLDRTLPSVVNGIFHGFGSDANVKSDANGKFTLPPRQGELKLLVLHETGWTELKKPAGEAIGDVPLRAWAKVEGKLMKGDKPWAAQSVCIDPERTVDTQQMSRSGFRYRTTTDAEGKFSFDRVLDGKVEIGVELTVNDGGHTSFPRSHQVQLSLAAGEHKTVQIGGSGRPVVAELFVPDDVLRDGLAPIYGELSLMGGMFEKPANWRQLTPEQQKQLRKDFEATPEYQAYMKRPKRFVGMIGADGMLRIDDVLPGEYTLMAASYRPSPENRSFYRYAATASTNVTVPPIPGGAARSDEAVDAGKLEVKRNVYLNVGSTAPLFEAMGLDGKPLKLADYRGKFVLVDFWATWCGPCIAEMKTLEKIDEMFGKDARLVMMSLSVDERIEQPRKFAAGQKMTGLQGYCGWNGDAARNFGVGGIPSIWLIAPDGKIIGKELEGEKLIEAVKQALQQ